jgi:hypothetical protein
MAAVSLVDCCCNIAIHPESAVEFPTRMIVAKSPLHSLARQPDRRAPTAESGALALWDQVSQVGTIPPMQTNIHLLLVLLRRLRPGAARLRRLLNS